MESRDNIVTYSQSLFQSAVPSKDIQRPRSVALRTRSSVACARCRGAKARCNDHRPCHRCILSGEADNCDIRQKSLRVSNLCVKCTKFLLFQFQYSHSSLQPQRDGILSLRPTAIHASDSSSETRSRRRHFESRGEQSVSANGLNYEDSVGVDSSSTSEGEQEPDRPIKTPTKRPKTDYTPETKPWTVFTCSPPDDSQRAQYFQTESASAEGVIDRRESLHLTSNPYAKPFAPFPGTVCHAAGGDNRAAIVALVEALAAAAAARTAAPAAELPSGCALGSGPTPPLNHFAAPGPWPQLPPWPAAPPPPHGILQPQTAGRPAGQWLRFGGPGGAEPLLSSAGLSPAGPFASGALAALPLASVACPAGPPLAFGGFLAPIISDRPGLLGGGPFPPLLGFLPLLSAPAAVTACAGPGSRAGVGGVAAVRRW
jgi:hypothetical protein